MGSTSMHVRTAAAAALVAVLVAGPGCDRSAPSSPTIARANSESTHLARATEIAQANLQQFIAALDSDEPELHGFTILTSYATSTGREQDVWISPTSFADGSFTGIVDDKPDDVTSISLGDTVTVAAEEVLDWMYLDSETLVGGWTVRVRIDFADPDQRDLMMQRFNLTERDLELPPAPQVQSDPQQTTNATQP